jgi:hypothetical protein
MGVADHVLDAARRGGKRMDKPHEADIESVVEVTDELTSPSCHRLRLSGSSPSR